MMPVRVLADDMTGALDASACFVGATGPLQVAWRRPFAAGDAVIDSETRDTSPTAAERQVAALVPELARAVTPFKKIDSLLRGNTIREISTCVSSRRFASVVLAPAFPAQRRITRGGRQLARDQEGERWREVGPVMLEMPGIKVTARHLGRKARGGGGGLLVCDTETDGDLASLPDRMARIDRPVLWIGSAGLARALAGRPVPVVLPRADRVLLIVGSNHPVTGAQVECLRARGIAVQDVATATGAERAGRASGTSVVVRLRPAGAQSHREHLRILAEALLASAAKPELFIATGGDTLMALLLAVSAERVAVEGEVEPGIPVGRIVGGSWDGCRFVSKAGGFGSRDTLAELLEATARQT